MTCNCSEGWWCLQSVLRCLILCVFSKRPTASIQAPACHFKILWSACHFRVLWSFLGVCWKISQSKQLFEHMVTISKKKKKLKIQDQLKRKDLKQQALKYSGIFLMILLWFYVVRADLISVKIMRLFSWLWHVLLLILLIT